MAKAKAYETKSGKRYKARYRDPQGVQREKGGFPTKREAEAYAASVEVAKLRGEYVAPSHARITVAELGPAWLQRQRGHLKPSSYAVMEQAWRLRVEPRWGAVALGDIRPTQYQAWIAGLTKGSDDVKPVSAEVVKRAHIVLSSILRDAVRDRLLTHDPSANTRLPKPTPKPKMYLTHQQVTDLAYAAGPHEALVLTLAYTGLRWGEAIGMRVRDLNMLRKRATITENAVQVGAQIHVGTTKAHKAREVPLPEFLLVYLARQCEGKGRDDLVFGTDDGEHQKRPQCSHGWFAKAVIEAGMPRVTPHDLRHTAASLAVSTGTNVKAVQKMLGHASAAMTLDVYADLFDDDLEKVASALDAARAREVWGKCGDDPKMGSLPQTVITDLAALTD